MKDRKFIYEYTQYNYISLKIFALVLLLIAFIMFYLGVDVAIIYKYIQNGELGVITFPVSFIIFVLLMLIYKLTVIIRIDNLEIIYAGILPISRKKISFKKIQSCEVVRILHIPQTMAF